MPTRRRPVAEFEATSDKLGTQTVTLAGVVGGYNGYSNPELLSPQFWAAASQVYGGLFGSIRRARFAILMNNTAGGHFFNGKLNLSLFAYLDTLLNVSPTNLIFVDSNDPTNAITPRYFISNPLGAVAQDIPSYFSNRNTNVFLLAKTLLIGPYQRTRIGSLILEANGLFRSKIFNSTITLQPFSTAYPSIAFWGIDAPDASPQITLNAGTTATIAASPTGAVRANNIVTITATAALPANFVTGAFVQISGVADTSFDTATGVAVQITVTGGTTFTFSQIGPPATSGSGTATLGITQTVGRSYQFAWECAATGHVSAPSPASQFVKYSNQTGTIDCIEVGTVAYSNGSAIVTGTGTTFTQAMVGKVIWAEGLAFTGSNFGLIISIQSATQLTMAFSAITTSAGGSRFQVYDPQVTHLRLYDTGDGGAVYFRTARNQITGSSTLSASGFEFIDTTNSQPPNAPFTSEITQNFNVPPPIGQFLADYQGRPIVFGVPGALGSFFYGNIETTVVGQPPESFAPLNQVTLPIGDGQLNGWANLPTGAIIWSNRQDMFKLTGLLSDNTVSNQFQLGATIQRLPYRLGSGSPYANTVTNLGVFWLTESRQVQLFTDHYAPKNVGFPIQDILNRINGRINFARMKNYKRGERNWLALALSLDSSTFNNKLCLLDLDLLASNGQPSFFTFDMATNQPTWYLFDINCESIESAADAISQNHLLCGDVDLITDADYHTGDSAVSENSVTGATVTLHALGNEAPEVMKQLEWMRANTNQLPSAIAAQGWSFGVLKYDDEQWVLGAANVGNLVSLAPGVDSSPVVIGLENSPADFRFDGHKFAKGRRFQLQVNFPTTAGSSWEFRGFQVRYTGLYER